jgi:hypothetical protein
MKPMPIPIFLSLALQLLAQKSSASPGPEATPLVPPTTRDGSKDFDFMLGTWNVHTRILRKLFVHSHDWEDCYARLATKAFENNVGEVEVGPIRCPGGQPVSTITVRLYDASTHQWSIYWASDTTSLIGPPQVGHFGSDGVGIFDAYYTYRGIPVISRYRWSVLPGNHPHFEQLYSNDNGKTWELNWDSVCTRVP